MTSPSSLSSQFSLKPYRRASRSDLQVDMSGKQPGECNTSSLFEERGVPVLSSLLHLSSVPIRVLLCLIVGCICSSLKKSWSLSNLPIRMKIFSIFYLDFFGASCFSSELLPF